MNENINWEAAYQELRGLMRVLALKRIYNQAEADQFVGGKDAMQRHWVAEMTRSVATGIGDAGIIEVERVVNPADLQHVELVAGVGLAYLGQLRAHDAKLNAGGFVIDDNGPEDLLRD